MQCSGPSVQTHSHDHQLPKQQEAAAADQASSMLTQRRLDEVAVMQQLRLALERVTWDLGPAVLIV